MRNARVDKNQAEIVKLFRRWGFLVSHRHKCGEGVPDLEVGLNGYLIQVEIKDPEKAKSARKLTSSQVEYFEDWYGFPVFVALNESDIGYLAEIIKRKPSAEIFVQKIQERNKYNGY